MKEVIEGNKVVKAAAWFLCLGAIIALLMFFRSFIQPLALAVILWFLIIELRVQFMKLSIRGRSFPKPIWTVISSVTVLYIFYLTTSIIIGNIQNLANNMSHYTSNLIGLLETLEKWVNLENLGERVQQDKSMLVRGMTSVATQFASVLGQFVLILFYVVFMLLEEATFHRKLQIMMDKSTGMDAWKSTFDRIYKLFHDYATIKVMTSLVTGVISYLILFFTGVELPALWAFIIFLFNFIPSIGSIAATLLTTVFSLVQFGLDTRVLGIFIGIAFTQVIIGNIVEPRIMGNRLNLSPLIVIISLTFWGFIWGVMGMILSVPITAMLMIIFSQFKDTRNIAILLSGNGQIADRIYDESFQGQEADKNKQ